MSASSCRKGIRERDSREIRHDAWSTKLLGRGSGVECTLVVFDDVAQVILARVVRFAHAHRVMGQVDVTVVACGQRIRFPAMILGRCRYSRSSRLFGGEMRGFLQKSVVCQLGEAGIGEPLGYLYFGMLEAGLDAATLARIESFLAGLQWKLS